MIPLNKRNKMRLILMGAVIGLSAAVAAPGALKSSSREAISKKNIAETVKEDDNSVELAVTEATEESANISSDIKADSNDTILMSEETDSITADGQEIPEDIVDVDSLVPETEDTIEEKEVEEPAPKFYTQGVSHSSVAGIQQQLMDLGFMDMSEPTELYGPATMNAVKMFQRQNEIKEDGILGPDTMELLMADNAKHYAAKLGMEGDDITRLQKRLYETGYLASKDQITGYFGDATETAVKKMQKNNGLSDDGKVGQMTVELLYSEDVKANLLSYGEESEIVLESQKRLKELGYLTTTPDGKYGKDTVAAVKQFQSRNDLVVDGYLGPSTREVLNSSSAVTNGLVLGDSGASVRRVQELLNKYGYLSSSSITEYFGDTTEAAVKAFQKNNGLSADGNVGVMTMAKLTGDNVVKANHTSSGNSGSNSGSTSSNSTSTSSSSAGSSSSTAGSSSGSTSASTSSNSSSANSGTTSNSSSVSALISAAKSKVGKPYVLGAKGPNAFDCSGFVYWCLNQVGVRQSYITSSGWASMSKYKKITNFSDIKAGDIIVVRGHVGIAAGNNTVIDASSSSGKIVYRTMTSWWTDRFICAWRIF